MGTNNSIINTESSMSGSESGKLEKEEHGGRYAYKDGRRPRNISDLIQACILKLGTTGDASSGYWLLGG